jgi:hypothetical protein
MVATLMDRLGHYEPAATIGGFAAIPIVRLSFPEVDSVITHLREVLGDERYESLARAGGSMTNAQMATYTFEHIDQARAELS